MSFPGVELLGTTPKFRKRKKNSSSYVYVLCNTSHKEILPHARAREATNCTIDGVVLLTKSISFLDVPVAGSVEASKGLFRWR